MKISMETSVNAAANHVWAARDIPQNVMRWNASDEDWLALESTVERHEADRLLARMEAIDSSMGFDFGAFPQSF